MAQPVKVLAAKQNIVNSISRTHIGEEIKTLVVIVRPSHVHSAVYICTCTHAYMHVCIHTYKHKCSFFLKLKLLNLEQLLVILKSPPVIFHQ